MHISLEYLATISNITQEDKNSKILNSLSDTDFTNFFIREYIQGENAQVKSLMFYILSNMLLNNHSIKRDGSVVRLGNCLIKSLLVEHEYDATSKPTLTLIPATLSVCLLDCSLKNLSNCDLAMVSRLMGNDVNVIKRAELISLISKNKIGFIAQYLSAPIIGYGWDQNVTLAFCLVQTESGRMLLWENPEFIQAITPESLNALIESGAAQGESLALWLAWSSEGGYILSDYPELLYAISPTCLNTTVPNGTFEGQSVASFVAYKTFLLEEISQQFGQTITPECLNYVAKNGVFQGESLAFWLAKSPVGRDVLVSNPQLVQAINSICLNSIIANGVSQGESVAFWLVRSIQGRTILDANPEIAQSINPNSLNALIISGAYKERAVASWLEKFTIT